MIRWKTRSKFLRVRRALAARSGGLFLWPSRPRLSQHGLKLHKVKHHYEVFFASGWAKAALPNRLRRYHKQRYTLFSKFDKGIKLDEEMWYSVTPEPIAKQQAKRVKSAEGGSVFVDSFCGAGGNSIALAKLGGFVLCSDLHRERLKSAQRNCQIYGVQCLDFLQADARQLHRLYRQKVDAVLLSPPWADQGIVEHGFSVRRLGQGLDAAELLSHAVQVAPQVALFLPRVTSVQEVRSLAVLAKCDVLIKEHVKVDSWGSPARRATAVTCYFRRPVLADTKWRTQIRSGKKSVPVARGKRGGRDASGE